MSTAIKISTNLADLTGKGTEYLVDTDGITIRAAFFDGNFILTAPSVDVECDTLSAA